MDLPLATPELRPRCSETASLCLPVTRSEGCNPSSLLSLTLRNTRVPLAFICVLTCHGTQGSLSSLCNSGYHIESQLLPYPD
jgi:hypothetical protein